MSFLAVCLASQISDSKIPHKLLEQKLGVYETFPLCLVSSALT